MARVAAAAAVLLAAAAISTGTGSARLSPPPVVGLVPGSAGGWVLRPVDPITLRPLPRSWHVAVGSYPVLARSPAGTGVAVAAMGRTRTVIVDARSGKVLRRYREDDSSFGDIYWLGSENYREALFLMATYGCWSHGCGDEYTELGSGMSSDYTASLFAATPDGFVSLWDDTGTGVLFFPAEREISLAKLPPGPTRGVADVTHKLLYVISSGGGVARVGPRSVEYHPVSLNGKPFEAAWAGSGKIALWGSDGLGTIDTWTWTTQAITTGRVAGVLPTTRGIAAWSGSDDGLTVYRTDGSRRFSVLQGEQVRAARSLGRYLYIDASVRWTVDLVTGRVLGRARGDVRLALPSYVRLL
jgi:hypothetical protein